MRTISLHDTLTGEIRALEPREPGRVGIYACGPTVYGRIHVGNARPFVVFSLLKRFFMHEGYQVTFVANITDVNDKIYAAAGEAGRGSAELAREMTEAYLADTDGLGLGRPDHEPLASQMIGEIIGLIERLMESGHAYAVEGDVYFRVRNYPSYGELSHRNIEEMDQGEGVEGAELKQDPLDFALWKAQKPGEDTAWDSPWGRGRPGWHIECSAMAEELLGVDFEIHGGGSDLIFPHHENEAAQTRAARGAPLARLWVHNGMIRLERAKMSKSVGNILILHEALAAYGRDAIVMYFCGGHYRQPVEFDDERLSEAAARVRRIREAGRRLVPGISPEWSGPLRERFFDALAYDFNTPRALAEVAAWVTEANRSEGAGGRRGSARDARRAGARAPARGRQRGGAGRGGRAERRARARARREGLRRGRPAARGDSRAGLGGPRRSRRAGAAAGGVIVYGRNPVREALRGPREVTRVWATKNAAREPWLGAGVSVTIASAEEVERRAGAGAHQGVCAEVEPFRYAAGEGLVSAAEPLIVVLDQIQDPQNLGAIARTAECAGASGIVIPERRAAEVTAAVCKASAGAVEHIPIARVRNVADWILEAKQHGIWCYGADAGARLAYDAVDWRGGAALVLGAEGRGVRPRVAASCDALVAIPLRGRIESLSVSAAAAVLLYAATVRRG